MTVACYKWLLLVQGHVHLVTQSHKSGRDESCEREGSGWNILAGRIRLSLISQL